MTLQQPSVWLATLGGLLQRWRAQWGGAVQPWLRYCAAAFLCGRPVATASTISPA